MAAHPFPPPEEGRRLHARLLAGEALAPSDLAVAYLAPLTTWLGGVSHGASPDQCRDAAEDALLALIKDPASYDPKRLELNAFLRMAARRDLSNIRRKEGRHHRGRRGWAAVEISPDGGKYLGRDDDPSLPLRIAEEQQTAVPESVRRDLDERESRVLKLILEGERRHDLYAQAYGVAHLPKAEQVKAVTRVKNRLKKRLERARANRA